MARQSKLIAYREERGDMETLKEAVSEPPKFSFLVQLPNTLASELKMEKCYEKHP